MGHVKITLRLLLLPLVASLALVGLEAPAGAAAKWGYVATAGGTSIVAGSGLVISNQTAQAAISGSTVPNTAKNAVASAAAEGVVRTGAVETLTTTRAVDAGTRIRSWARTAGVNVLDGLVTIDAVTTQINTVAKPDGTTSVTGGTQFAGIHIAGVNLPLEIKRNLTVTVKGVATITLNAFATGTASGSRASQGWGIGVALLKDQGTVPAGSVIMVNPVYQTAVPANPAVATFSGDAFGARAVAKVGDGTTVEVPPSAIVRTPPGGSDGETLRNTTAGVNVAGVLTTGAVESTSTSDTFGTNNKNADIVNTAQLARVNLLNGLVTADAIKVRARSHREAGVCTGGGGLTLVNLKIAGRAIPVDVKPNTTITIEGVAKVIVNQRIRSGCATLARGVYVELLKPRGELPLGATVEIAKAQTRII